MIREPQIEHQVEILKNKIRDWHDGNVPDWIAAEPAAIGFLDGGEIGLLIHAGRHADETCSYLYGRSGDAWVLIEEQGCQRLDNYGSFPQLNGRKFDDWPLQRTARHPNIQRNRYFTNKSEEFNQVWGKQLLGGEIRFDIDDQLMLFDCARLIKYQPLQLAAC